MPSDLFKVLVNGAEISGTVMTTNNNGKDGTMQIVHPEEQAGRVVRVKQAGEGDLTHGQIFDGTITGVQNSVVHVRPRQHNSPTYTTQQIG